MSGLAVLTPPDPSAIFPLPAALAMLAEATTVDEVKSLRDQAETFRQLIRTRKLGLDRQNDAAEVKLRAERKLGDLLSETTTHRELRDVTTGQVHGSKPTLPDGISKIQSFRWHRISALPEADFEKWIAQTRAAGEELTQAALLRLADIYIRIEQSKLNPNSGGAADSDEFDETDDDTPDDTDYTRAVHLYFTVSEREEFRANCDALADSYGTSNITDTVFECVRRATEEEER